MAAVGAGRNLWLAFLPWQTFAAEGTAPKQGHESIGKADKSHAHCADPHDRHQFGTQNRNEQDDQTCQQKQVMDKGADFFR